MAQRLIRTYALPVSEFNATLKCRECEIFIGEGHEDKSPIPAPEGDGIVCRSCYISLQRRSRSTSYPPVNWNA